MPAGASKSVGAYFAYLRHPFAGVPAQKVAEGLAAERGVLACPELFRAGPGGHLRVAFANVGADVLAGLAPRLAGLAEAF